MIENDKTSQVIKFDCDTIDAFIDKHFPEGSWWSSDSLITQYPAEQAIYRDIYMIFGSEDFEAKYGNDPIGCIYETHEGAILGVSYI